MKIRQESCHAARKNIIFNFSQGVHSKKTIKKIMMTIADKLRPKASKLSMALRFSANSSVSRKKTFASCSKMPGKTRKNLETKVQFMW